MLLGYVEFVLLLFLPGLAFVGLLGLRKSLVEELALAFGFSLSLDVLVLVVETSGFTLDGVKLLGISPNTLDFILAVSVVGIIASTLWRRRLPLAEKLARQDLLVLLVLLAQIALISLYFAKYPIFPQYRSIDFEQHVRIMYDLQRGVLSSLPGGLLYYGVHLLMGSALALVGGEHLLVSRQVMGVLVALSPLLVYCAVSTISKSPKTGLISMAIYVGSGFLWYESAFDGGLYPNFYGLLASLVILTCFGTIWFSGSSPQNWIAYLVALAAGAFSHYTVVLFFPAFLVSPLLYVGVHRKLDLRIILAGGFPLFVSGLILISRPDLLSQVSHLISMGAGGAVVGDTPLSASLAFSPVVRYAVALVTDDWGAISIILVAVLATAVGVRRKDVYTIILAVWLLTTLAIAPTDTGAWRFSYAALFPLMLLASLGYVVIYDATKVPSSAIRRSRKSRKKPVLETPLVLGAALAILLFPVFVGSWGNRVLVDSVRGAAQNASEETSVYQTILWVSQNVTVGGAVLSPSDWRFIYMELLDGRAGGFAELIPPDAAYTSSYGYLAITRIASNSSDQAVTSSLFSQYAADSRFKLIYQNQNVDLYLIQRTGSG